MVYTYQIAIIEIPLLVQIPSKGKNDYNYNNDDDDNDDDDGGGGDMLLLVGRIK